MSPRCAFRDGSSTRGAARHPDISLTQRRTLMSTGLPPQKTCSFRTCRVRMALATDMDETKHPARFDRDPITRCQADYSSRPIFRFGRVPCTGSLSGRDRTATKVIVSWAGPDLRRQEGRRPPAFEGWVASRPKRAGCPRTSPHARRQMPVAWESCTGAARHVLRPVGRRPKRRRRRPTRAASAGLAPTAHRPRRRS